MRIKTIPIIAFCLFLKISLLLGQESSTNAFSLSQAQQYGIDNNVNAKNSQLDIQYSKKQVLETTAIGLPQINGSINYTNFIDLPTSLIPAEFFGGEAGQMAAVQFGTNQNLSLQIAANQLIFDGTYIVGLQAAKVYVDLAKKKAQLSERDIRLNIAKAYYANLIVTEQASIVNKNVANLEKSYFETGQMYQNGFVEKLDLDRLELALSALKAQQQNIERQQILAATLLKYQMGFPQNEEIILTDSLQGLTNQISSDFSNELIFSNRIEFQALQTQISLAKLDIRRYRYGYLPSVSAFVSHQDDANRNEFNFFKSDRDWFKTNMWGVSVKVPIFDSFSKSSKIQKAKIDLLKLKNAETNLSEALALEVVRANTNYINAIKSMETQKKNLVLAEDIYNTTITKYNEGVGSSIERTNAQTALYNTQANYIASLHDLLNAKTDLDKALGTK